MVLSQAPVFQPLTASGLSTDPVSATESGPQSSQRLSRQLSRRHIQLIAIGGTIGTGLFMGSGKTISLAGPSIILAYLIIGFMLFFVMRAMGELLLSNLRYESFVDVAADLLGPWAGFFAGWTYWFCWIGTGVAEIVAISAYVTHWWPNMPLWIPALCAVGLLIVLNLPTVKAFGETEFWFAMIKIIAIVALIVVGLVMIFTHVTGPSGHEASLTNLWSNGGFFPTGLMGFVAGFQIATFAFVGIELVGTAAAETTDPKRNLPKAINTIPVRLLLFYVASLVVIMSVIPWQRIDPSQSPFVTMFGLAGLGIAASVINFVVLTSAASSANAGIYSTSRIVYGLARTGDAPRKLGKLTSRQVPANALFLTGILLLSAVVMVAAGKSVVEVFTVVTTISALCFMFIWAIILISYLVYRKRRPHLHAASQFKMPAGVVMCYVVLAFFAFLIWAFTQEHDTLRALLATPVWFAVLGIAWAVLRRRSRQRVCPEALATFAATR